MCSPELNACCAYFCTGMSIFGIFGLVRAARAGARACRPPATCTRAARTCALVARPAALDPRRPRPPAQTVFGIIINSGGGWYLGVPEADSESAARACFVAAAIYLGFLVFCCSNLMRINAKKAPPGAEELNDDDEGKV